LVRRLTRDSDIFVFSHNFYHKNLFCEQIEIFLIQFFSFNVVKANSRFCVI
jgi:hypothetical protein